MQFLFQLLSLYSSQATATVRRRRIHLRLLEVVEKVGKQVNKVHHSPVQFIMELEFRYRKPTRSSYHGHV